MNIPNTNKSARNHAAALLGAAFLCILPLALSIGTASAAPTSPPAPTATLLTTFNAIAFGCTVGPDGMLYVTDPTHGQILRVEEPGDKNTSETEKQRTKTKIMK